MLINGDNLDVLKTLQDNSIDSCVTDPPYGLAFMGKKWDYDVPSVELWREVFRVLKPGGHVLSFGGTRTYHRMVVAIEDAGFEIRDQVQWIYGSGFPKSHDVSKGIDKAKGAEREVVGEKDVGPDFRGDNFSRNDGERMIASLTTPATDLAKQWQGWGTALKPANEPIVLARKPLIGTVAENVETYGTGAINVDASRIGTDQVEKGRAGRNAPQFSGKYNNGEIYEGKKAQTGFSQGRWPANVLFDEDAARVLDEQSGPCKTGGRNIKTNCGDAFFKVNVNTTLAPDTGSGASRFFYVAKASKRERNAGLEGMPEKDPPGSKRSTPAEGRSSSLGAPRANHHPTVKPIKLMEYLVRMITPPNGVCLDPFMGSGSTGVACKNLGFEFVGVELNKEYFEIAERRVVV